MVPLRPPLENDTASRNLHGMGEEDDDRIAPGTYITGSTRVQRMEDRNGWRKEGKKGGREEGRRKKGRGGWREGGKTGGNDL